MRPKRLSEKKKEKKKHAHLILTPPAPMPSKMRQYSSCLKMSAPTTPLSNVRRALPAAPLRKSDVAKKRQGSVRYGVFVYAVAQSGKGGKPPILERRVPGNIIATGCCIQKRMSAPLC